VDPLVCPRCAGTMRIIAARLSLRRAFVPSSGRGGQARRSRRSRDRTCLCPAPERGTGSWP
jgi:hypothetical protein